MFLECLVEVRKSKSVYLTLIFVKELLCYLLGLYYLWQLSVVRPKKGLTSSVTHVTPPPRRGAGSAVCLFAVGERRRVDADLAHPFVALFSLLSACLLVIDEAIRLFNRCCQKLERTDTHSFALCCLEGGIYLVDTHQVPPPCPNLRTIQERMSELPWL
jgi:hypothetical protein